MIRYSETDTESESVLELYRGMRLGPDEGAATAVYAGFHFRRRYVRETLSGDVSEALLESAVPFSQLADQPAGAGVESFKMKPSFAYAQRLCERLPGAAPRCAEMRRDAPRCAERSREAPRCDETRAATLLAASLPPPRSAAPEALCRRRLEHNLRARGRLDASRDRVRERGPQRPGYRYRGLGKHRH